MSGVYHNIVLRGASRARRACAHGVAAPLLRSDAWIGWPRERVSSALQLLPLPLPGRASFTLHGIYSGFKFKFFKRSSKLQKWKLAPDAWVHWHWYVYVYGFICNNRI